MVLGNEKRAVSDEAIRDTLPTEGLNVSNAPTLDKLANLTVNPGAGTGSMFLNPDIFEPLARISEKIHETRRGSRQKDYIAKGTDEINEIRLNNYMDIQKDMYDANKTLMQLRGDMQVRLEQLMQDANKVGSPLSRTQVLEIVTKELQTLSDRNLEAGNYYIADRLADYNSLLREKTYPVALAQDVAQKEEELKLKWATNTYRHSINVAGGIESWEDSLLQNIGENIQTSNMIDSPTDQINSRNNNQLIYLAEAKRIAENPNASIDERVGALKLYLAGITPTGDIIDVNKKLKEIYDENDGKMPLEPFFIAKGYVYGTRVATEAEKLAFENAGVYDELTQVKFPSVEELQQEGKLFTKDENGNLLVSEIWDVSPTNDTITAIQETLSKMDKRLDVNNALDYIQWYKRSTQFDDLNSGNLLENTYLRQTDFSTAMSDYKQFINHTVNLINSGVLTASEQQKALNTAREVGQVMFSSIVTYAHIDALSRQGYSASESVNSLLDMKGTLDTLLNEKSGDGFISQEDLSKVIGLEVNGVFQPFIIDDAMLGVFGKLDDFSAGKQRYAYAVELSKRLGKAIEELSNNPGLLNQMNAYVNQKKVNVDNLMSPSRLVSVDDAGKVSTDLSALQQAQAAASDYIETAIHNTGIEGKNAAIMSITKTSISHAQSIEDPVRRNEYIRTSGRIIGPDLMNIGTPANMSAADKAVMTQMKVYSLLDRSAYAHEYSTKVTRFHSGENAGLPSLTWSNANNSVKPGGAYGKIKIEGGSGGTLTEKIDSIAKKYVNVENFGTARELALQMIEADAASGSTSFSLKKYEDVLASNFKKGTYLHEPTYDTSRLVPGSPTQMQQNSVQAFLDRQDEFNNNLKSASSANKGATVARDSVGIKIVKPNGVDMTYYDENGKEHTSYIYNDIYPGVDGTSALNTKGQMISYMNNLYAYTNTDDPYLYQPGSVGDQVTQKTGLTKQDMAGTALSLYQTLNTKDAQMHLQNYHAHPEQYNNVVNRKDPKWQLYYAMANNGLPTKIDPNSISAPLLATANIKEEEIKAKKADDLMFLDSLKNNRGTIPTLNYNPNTVKTGDLKNTWVLQGSFYLPGGITGRYSSPWGQVRTITRKDGSKYTYIHEGTDIIFENGSTKVTALWSGKVLESGFQEGNGYYLKWQDEQGYVFMYLHMAAKPKYKPGDMIQYGDTVGLSGRTGFVYELTGNQTILDFRIYKNKKSIDPRTFKQQPQNIAPVDRKISVHNQVKGAYGQIQLGEVSYIDANVNTMHKLNKEGAELFNRNLNQPGGLYNTGSAAQEDNLKFLTYCYGSLMYGPFKGSRNSRAFSIAALNPKVTFTYTTQFGPISSPELQKVNGLQLIRLQKDGKLKNLPDGQWIPDNRAVFDAEVARYNKHMKGK